MQQRPVEIEDTLSPQSSFFVIVIHFSSLQGSDQRSPSNVFTLLAGLSRGAAPQASSRRSRSPSHQLLSETAVVEEVPHALESSPPSV